MSDFNDMFDMSADTFLEPSKESVMYSVKPENGKNGVYSSLIRFLPWVENSKESIIERWESWLQNPITGKGMSLVCPSSLGKNHPSELRDIYWKLKNGGEEEKAKTFSRRRTFYAIVQILQDDNEPDLVGKLKIYKFGIKIFDKIQAELKPDFGEPHIPFHPFKGKAFNLKGKKVSGFNNYDESKFVGEAQPILDNGAPITDQEALVSFLKANSPKLSDFAPKEWTADQTAHFEAVKAAVVPNTQEAVAQVQTESLNENLGDAPKIESDIDVSKDTEAAGGGMEDYEFKIE